MKSIWSRSFVEPGADSFRFRPSTSTGTLAELTAYLRRQLVGPDPLEAGEPQPPVRGPLGERHLDHDRRPHPGDLPPADVRRQLAERRLADHQRAQGPLHRPQPGAGETGADLAGVDEPVVV